MRHGWVIGMLVVGLACGPKGETDSGDSGSSDTGAGTMTGGTTSDSATTSPMMTSGATGDATSADSTGVPPGDTSAEGTTTGMPGTDTGESSSTGGEPTGPAYPPCAFDQDPVCPEPYEQCVEIGGGPGGGGASGTWCTIPCQDVAECPAPDSGTAEVVCGGPPMQPTRCELDCSMGECPDGMDCVGLGPMGQIMRCVWPSA